MPATFRFLVFFRFFRFFLLKLVYFWTKSRKNISGCFFHSICATDLNFGAKINGRTKLSTLKTLMFANCWGPEVVASRSYQKNIFLDFTHLYIYILIVSWLRLLWTTTTLDTLIHVHSIHIDTYFKIVMDYRLVKTQHCENCVLEEQLVKLFLEK